jgi:hypothetical protein
MIGLQSDNNGNEKMAHINEKNSQKIESVLHVDTEEKVIYIYIYMCIQIYTYICICIH